MAAWDVDLIPCDLRSDGAEEDVPLRVVPESNEDLIPCDLRLDGVEEEVPLRVVAESKAQSLGGCVSRPPGAKPITAGIVDMLNVILSDKEGKKPMTLEQIDWSIANNLFPLVNQLMNISKYDRIILVVKFMKLYKGDAMLNPFQYFHHLFSQLRASAKGFGLPIDLDKIKILMPIMGDKASDDRLIRKLERCFNGDLVIVTRDQYRDMVGEKMKVDCHFIVCTSAILTHFLDTAAAVSDLPISRTFHENDLCADYSIDDIDVFPDENDKRHSKRFCERYCIPSNSFNGEKVSRVVKF
ncbi:MAG: hypothetical protein Hyperionvirus22_30 [Hyperionvirus sp.]|uniref:Uncharacterized protein n=1 Tax=Hyperionvirus sp. TaxID=2487770 RepID=A0A3G5AG17_9VIRU|nr:MAG: hypothetical protein Hyperionvirus22_30 [Hyperionvirus sp.]